MPDSEVSKFGYSDKHFRPNAGAFSKSAIEVLALREATSMRLSAIILSKIVDIVDMNYIDMNLVDITPFGPDIVSFS